MKTNDLIVARLIEDEKERETAFKMRYEIFVTELGWIPGDQRKSLENEMKEIDKFDEGSVFLGVFHNRELVAHTRITDHRSPWMFDTTFRHLLSSPIKKDNDTLESTRLFVPVQHRKMQKLNGMSFFYTKLLQYAEYEYCKVKKCEKVGVFTETVFRLLRRQGMPVFSMAREQIKRNRITIPTLIDWSKIDAQKFFQHNHIPFFKIDL